MTDTIKPSRVGLQVFSSVNAIYVCEKQQSCDCCTIVYYSNRSPLDLSMSVN